VISSAFSDAEPITRLLHHTREQHQSCLKKKSKLNLLRHGCDVAPFFAAADNNSAARCRAWRNWTAFRKA
jgi:hypothetical protein